MLDGWTFVYPHSSFSTKHLLHKFGCWLDPKSKYHIHTTTTKLCVLCVHTTEATIEHHLPTLCSAASLLSRSYLHLTTTQTHFPASLIWLQNIYFPDFWKFPTSYNISFQNLLDRSCNISLEAYFDIHYVSVLKRTSLMNLQAHFFG